MPSLPIMSSSEAEKVIALVLGTSIVGAAVLGWYAHKAVVAIQAWGEKMNEQDAIFQSVAAPEEMLGSAIEPKKDLSSLAVELEDQVTVSMATSK